MPVNRQFIVAMATFDDHSHGEKVDVDTLFELDEDTKRKLWILTDQDLTNPDWGVSDHSWFLVLAASPKKISSSKQWERERNASRYYIGNWNWDEIFAAFWYAICHPRLHTTD